MVSGLVAYCGCWQIRAPLNFGEREPTTVAQKTHAKRRPSGAGLTQEVPRPLRILMPKRLQLLLHQRRRKRENKRLRAVGE